MLSTPPLTVANHHQQPLLYFSTNNSFQPPTLFHYFLQLQPFLSTIFVYSTNFCVQPLNQPFSSHFHPPIFATHTYFFLPTTFSTFLFPPLLTTIFFYPFSLLATFRQQPIPHFVSATFCQQANNPTHFLATSLPLAIFFKLPSIFNWFLALFPPPPVFLDQMCCLPTAHLGGELCRGPSS